MATLAHWYYNTESGELTQSTNSVTGFFTALGFESVAAFGGAGWHELNITGSATAAQAAAEAKKEFPTGKSPTTSVSQGLQNQVIEETGAGNWLAGITGISGTNLVNRALKILIGSALVIIGVAHLTGASGSLAAAARKAPLPV